MHLLFLAAAHQVSASMAHGCPTWTLSSGAMFMADVMTGLLTLGFGILIFRLPPEK
jgi:hypothetical protein